MNTSGASQPLAAPQRGVTRYVGRISVTSAALVAALAAWILFNAWLA